MNAEQYRRAEEGPLGRRRVEEKYLVSEAAATTIEALVAAHLAPRLWTPDGETQVTSIYLDREDGLLRALAARSAANGLRLRAKAYLPTAATDGPPKCVLELKRHRDERSAKRRVWVSREALEEFCDLRLAQVPRELRPFGLVRSRFRLLPVTVVSYLRRVYEDRDALRVTFDRSVRWHRPDPALLHAGASLARTALPEIVGGLDRVVVEVKHRDQPVPPWLVDALAGEERLRAFSKFVAGLAATEAAGTERISGSC